MHFNNPLLFQSKVFYETFNVIVKTHDVVDETCNVFLISSDVIYGTLDVIDRITDLFYGTRDAIEETPTRQIFFNTPSQNFELPNPK